MDLRKIIHELELEKQRLDEAIGALEKLAAGPSRRKRAAHQESTHAQATPENAAVPELPSLATSHSAST